MAKTPDIQTRQQHRAGLRKSLLAHPENEPVRKALLKSLRPKFVQQAAQNGVFICYAMNDGVFALDLALALRDLGIRAFLDELEADETMDWGDTVNQALRDCAVLVMVLSPDGIDDGEVRGEYTYFMRTGKVIVPVIASDCDTSTLPTMIPPINFVDNRADALKQLKELFTVESPATI